MGKTKKAEAKGIEIPALNEKEPIKWDDLITMYNDVKGYINTSLATTEKTGDTFANIIESNPKLVETYSGVVKSLVDFSQELVSILDKHSESENLPDGKISYKPYIGEVDIENDKQRELYVALVIAYGGLIEKVQDTFDIIETHLLGLINTEAEKQGLKDQPVINTDKEGVKTVLIDDKK